MIRPLIVAAGLSLAAACTPQQQAAVSTVCRDLASMPPAAVAILDAQDTHGAIGVLWADAKSGCANGVPAIGVDQSWTGLVMGELKALLPAMLPQLIPLLIGLL